MSKRNKTAGQEVQARRVAEIVLAPEFTPSFAVFLAKSPRIVQRLDTFIASKNERPPQLLPRGMMDHALVGPLSGFSECHLDGDACLIYTDKANVVTVIAVVSHDEMAGSRGRALSSRIGHYRG